MRFGRKFNQSIKKLILPSSLKILQFGFYFNQPIKKNYFPPSLEFLQFGEKFNQPIHPGILPGSLKDLIIPYESEFNQRVNLGWIPEWIEKLIIGKKFKFPLIEGIFPSSLIELNCHINSNQSIQIGIFPLKLQNLILHFRKKSNSIGIFNLLKNYFLNENQFISPLITNSLPSELKSLIIIGDYVFPLFPSILPDSLEKLKIYNFFFPIPPEFLPPQLNGKFQFISLRAKNSEFQPGNIVNLKKSLKLHGEIKIIQLEEKLGIPRGLKFRVVEKINWNENIYLIEIVQEQFQNGELKNISWNRLLVQSECLELLNCW